MILYLIVLTDSPDKIKKKIAPTNLKNDGKCF